jgi:hypothetical protein
VPSAEERFRAKVQRRGGHEVWTGSRDDRGVGMVRIDGKLKTVQRAAWEFAYGPVEAGARVNTCASERACVTVAHLSLSPTTGKPAARRRRRGTGSVREVRPGTWEITVTDGTTAGQRRRRALTVHGDRRDAEAELDRVRTLLARDDLGDLRIRELVGRYLEDLDGSARRGRNHDADLLAGVLDPALGEEIAAIARPLQIQRGLEHSAAIGTPLPDVRDALRLLRRSYQWAIDRNLHNDDPTAHIDTRWLGR